MNDEAGRDLTLPEHQRRVKSSVDAAIRAMRAIGYAVYWQNPREIAEVNALHQLAPDLQRSVVIDLVTRRVHGTRIGRRLLSMRADVGDQFIYGKLMASFANRVIPYTRPDTVLLLHQTSDLLKRQVDEAIEAVPQTVVATERVVERGGVGELDGAIDEMIDALGGYREGRVRAAKYRARLVALRGDAAATVDPHMVTDGDTWGSLWKQRIAEVPSDLHPILIHVTLASAVEPSQAWQARARTLAASTEARALLRAMLADIETTRMNVVPHVLRSFISDPDDLPVPSFQDRNALVLRGVIWAAALSGAGWAPNRLGEIGILCGTSPSGNNEAREVRLANSCAAALGSIDSEAAFAALGRMKRKVTNRNVTRQIAKALDKAAVRRGTSPSELLELAIRDPGLGPNSRREKTVGDQVAVLEIGEDGTAGLVWRDPDGRTRANPARRTADTYPAEVASLKEEAKDLKKALAAERARIEDLFVEDREWDLQTWRQRYLDHPLTGSFGRRLIWRFVAPDGSTETAMPDEGGLRASDGSPFEPADGTRVRLWHPIDAREADIAAWRTAVMARRIRQPFKQAFREVYLLTPAEEETETYSNRFAAHILLYGRARALMGARRWATNFLGPFDGGYEGIAKREFPTHRLRAEFYHDALESEEGGDVLHCSTDQLRFVPMVRGEEAAVPLRDVPAIVFAEAMRDVDLFVGVSSVAADRNWQDAGQDRAGRYAQLDVYFSNYWDQGLSANAQVRRDVIDRLLPGLVIGDRVELLDRWLRVRGDLRTYRIHLGSGNILMEPSDTYLCIVPGRGASASTPLFLPFEDDPMLSLILSKAFLLARDAAITDRSITSQIRRG